MSIFDQWQERLEAQNAEMTIVRSTRIGSHVQDVTLRLPRGMKWEFAIGSYIQPMIGGCIPRCYSVADYDATSCRLIVSFSRHGVGSRFFAEAPVGTKVRVYGPFDDFPFVYDTHRPKMFFATGTGVAPFLLMVQEAIKEHEPCMLLLGSPEEHDLCFNDEFSQLATVHEHFHYVPVLSHPDDSWKGEHGYITTVASKHPDLLRKSDIYVCGVPPMVEGVQRMIDQYAVPKDQLFIQKFG